MNAFTKGGLEFICSSEISTSSSISRLDSRGRVLIPACFRRALRLGTGSKLLLSLNKTGIQLKPANGLQKRKVSFRSAAELAEFISSLGNFISLSVQQSGKHFILEIIEATTASTDCKSSSIKFRGERNGRTA